MLCYNCGAKVEVIERIGYRQVCRNCDAWLHSCVNCRFWIAGNCTEPSAEKVRDPEAQNFCEWFKERAEDKGLSAEKKGDRVSAEEMWKKLTGKKT